MMLWLSRAIGAAVSLTLMAIGLKKVSKDVLAWRASYKQRQLAA